MFEKVLWLTEHQNGMLFINGHNGHIGRTSVSGYTCMGELLADSLDDKYFAIGTDATPFFNPRMRRETFL